MQYQIVLTFPDVADVFEIAEILAPFKGNPKVKFAAAQPRPSPVSGAGGINKPAQEKIEAARARARERQLQSPSTKTEGT